MGDDEREQAVVPDESPDQATAGPQESPIEPDAAPVPVAEANIQDAGSELEEGVSQGGLEPATTAPAEDAEPETTTSPEAEPLEDDVVPPPPGKALRSHPPPKPRPSEPPLALARVLLPEALVEPTAEQGARQDPQPLPAASLSPLSSAALSPRRALSPVVLSVMAGAVLAASFVGYSVGSPSAQNVADAAAKAAAAMEVTRATAFAEGKAKQGPLPAVFDLSPPPAARTPSETVSAEPGTRTKNDVLALGRYWDRERLSTFDRFIAQLKQSPGQLEDAEVRAEVLKYVGDRSTSRVMLELLAELGQSRALDLLYEVWIGSKDRNETTQLAEALLLVPEVRRRASGSLELALKLREKPVACETIIQLVETAIREGDRRSAMPLVNTSARTNCGSSGDMECVKCLPEPKDMRRAINAIAVRPDPLR